MCSKYIYLDIFMLLFSGGKLGYSRICERGALEWKGIQSDKQSVWLIPLATLWKIRKKGIAEFLRLWNF